MSHKRLRLAVLLSGGGRTMANLHEHIRDQQLNAKIDIVISSRADVAGIERAQQYDLKTVIIDRKQLPVEAFQAKITEAVKAVDLVCMAGFMSLWRIPESFLGRVINIHPALLPEFGGQGMFGHRVHEAVLAAGKKESGCTVHFCDNEYDHGPVILQRKVQVTDNDTPETLATRIFEQECIAYPDALRLFCEQRIHLENGRVVMLPE